MYDVVTIGDSFEDLFVKSSDFKVIKDRSFKSGKSLSFDYGAKIDIENLEYYSGGSAINCALAFSKINLSTSIFSFLGSDSAGEKILDELNMASIGTGSIRKSNHPTNCSIILRCSGDRTILSYHGDNNYDELAPAKSFKSGWFYLAPIGKKADKLENRLIENIAKNGSGLIWNPGPTQIKKGARTFKHLLRLINIIFLNREEAMSFSGGGRSETEEVMKKIKEFGPKIVVVTDGKNGAKCFDGEVFYSIETTEDKRVDATGAGDAFASAFSSCIIKNCQEEKAQKFVPIREVIEQSLKWGIIVSGSVVGQIGAHGGLLTIKEISDQEKKLVKLEPSVYTK